MSARPAVEVLVGLIADDRGRWLINCRPAGTALAGFWEFPGGKRQPNETPRAALDRELYEELGIEVLDAERFLALAHDYGDKHVRLDVWRVLSFRGVVAAREGQPLRWVTLDELAHVRLLEADGPIVARLRSEARPPP